MALLTLVRHGQSTYNLENRFTGNVDVELTDLGRHEALLAGEKLADFTYDFAYTSMLKRAWETLSIILTKISQLNLLPIKNEALNERKYGSLQGLNKTETTEKYGLVQVELWRRSYNVRPPDGESLEDTFNRTVPYYKAEIEPKLREGKNVLVVAHGNSLRALLMYLEIISPQDITKINIPTGSPRNYVFDENMKLISVNYL
jgi:2,3-bisphosphoglycerate-dependent phosphoglycerate mutase